jgi:hypothetical protein
MRDFIGKIFGFYAEINNLKVENANLTQDVRDYKEKVKINETRIEQLQKEATKLLGEIEMLGKQIEIEDPNETFWNNKYPKQDISYNARAFFNSNIKTPVDVRIFFQYNDFNIESIVNSTYVDIGKLNEGTFDERALKCLKWVRKNFKYVSDKEVVNMQEFWMFPFESLYYKKGDCDDGAILLANLMMAAKVPYWRVRLNAGDVKGGGHCYVTYCRETDNQFVCLDWCYWYEDAPVASRVLHKDQRDYYSIWFSWNRKYAFGKMETMACIPESFESKSINDIAQNCVESKKRVRK